MSNFKVIVFFDFDGTITKNDTLLDFVKFSVGIRKYFIGLLLLAPILIAFKLKLIPNHIAKEKFISYFFKGFNAERFKKIANQYSLEKIDLIVNNQAMEKIKWHQKRGHKIVVVSASMECWLKAWCDKYQLDLIATQLEIKNNNLTGRFKTKNCHGKEKVNRIKEKYDISAYDQIYAYGDSRGDKEMLELAHKAYFKPFRN